MFLKLGCLGVIVAMLALVAVVCGYIFLPQHINFGGTTSQHTAASDVLNIAVGTEHKEVVDTVIQPWCAQHHVMCNITALGSVDQTRALQGDPNKVPYDAFLFADDAFQRSDNQQNALEDTQPIFSTPVVYAGWKSEMDRLGFTGREVKIDDIVRAINANQTKVWAPNPSQSNAGAAMLIGFLNYFASNNAGDAVTVDQLNSKDVRDKITGFTRHFDHTPPSVGALMDECVAAPDRCRTLFTYESFVIEYNKRLVAAGKEPLYVVYPQGGLAVSNTQFGFLPHGDDIKRDNFGALQAYLLSQEGQDKVAALGWRPAEVSFWDHPLIKIDMWVSQINVHIPKDVLDKNWGIEPELKQDKVSYPDSSVTNKTLNDYQTDYRKPTDVYYCLDGSGSMNDNGGRQGVRQASSMLFNPTVSAQYLLQIHPQDSTTVDIFNHGKLIEPMRVDGNNADQLRAMDTRIQNLLPSGNTAIYDCLGRAADHFNTAQDEGKKRLVTLMTDGNNTAGGTTGLDQIAELHVPVNTIGFGGDADVAALKNISARTGGVYNPSNDLPTALREATAYK